MVERTAVTFIDLGELTEPTEPAPPLRTRRRRPGRSRTLLALLASVTLLVVAGAAPPTPRVRAILPAALAVFLSTEHVFTVVAQRGVTDGSQELLAYRRPEPTVGPPQPLTPLWRMPLGSFHGVQLVESVADGVLLILAPTGQADHNYAETLLLDGRTGQERWRRSGTGTLDPSGRLLLQTDAAARPDRLTVVEVASGRELWSSSAAWASYHEPHAVVVTYTPAGDIEVLDPATGAVRGRLSDVDEPSDRLYAAIAGDLVVVLRNPTTVVGYDLDGLVQRWRVSVTPVDYVTGCGDLLCARAHHGGTQLLDPVTGAVRWTHVTDADDVYIDLAGERRALAMDFRPSTPGVTAIDAATGRTAPDYGTWARVAGPGLAPYLLGVRSVAGGGLVLARLDPAQPQPRRIDVLAGAVDGCQYRAGLIACRRHGGDFGLWQLPD
ncbi:hypothetical protein QQG74_08460 [Micromonospora sp. FIMYZ51]|uniref:outer membrane protein assembly factor BamB family protein n=1 Tax=Micromonospora sp. FIMYZ51 TaxID=3051832 RepID=UPI00311F6B11